MVNQPSDDGGLGPRVVGRSSQVHPDSRSDRTLQGLGVEDGRGGKSGGQSQGFGVSIPKEGVRLTDGEGIPEAKSRSVGPDAVQLRRTPSFAGKWSGMSLNFRTEA